MFRWPLYVSVQGALALGDWVGALPDNSKSNHAASYRSLRNHTATTPNSDEEASLICFNQWIRADTPIDLSAALLLFAIATLLLAVYFFLALPETDGITFICHYDSLILTNCVFLYQEKC